MTDDRPDTRRASRLSVFTQLAEIAASVGVLVTLVFLAVQVRQNTEITRSACYDSSMEGLNAWRLTIASDPDLALLWRTYASNDSATWSARDDARVTFLVNTLWGVYENAYYSNERGLLGPSEWSRFEEQICAQYERDRRRDAWAARGDPGASSRLTQEFARHVESAC